MIRNYLITSACFFFVSLSSLSQASQHIILKLDDFEFNPERYKNAMNVRAGWLSSIEYLIENSIPASIGIVAEHLGKPSDKHNDWVKSLDKNGIEFWHHGLDHDKNGQAGEFHGHSYNYQKSHLNQAYTLVKRNYDIEMKSIGTPYNQNDDVFLKVFSEDNRLAIGFFIKGSCPVNKLCLERFGMHLEEKVGSVNFEYFLKFYEMNRSSPYLVLQGHPGQWDKHDLDEFKKVILFLISQGAIFTTPYEYAKQL